MKEVNLGIIVALIKKLATKTAGVGIKSVSSGTNSGITFTLTNGSTYTVQLNDVMLKSLYDRNGNNIVEQAEDSQKLGGVSAADLISRINWVENHSEIWDNEIGDNKKDIDALYKGENLKAGSYIFLDKKEREVTIGLNESIINALEHGHDFILDIKEGWTCYTSLNGLKIATLGVDYEIEWEDKISVCLGGKRAKNAPYSERLPKDYFKAVVSLEVSGYDYAEPLSRIKMMADSQYSNNYTGDWDVIYCSVDDTFGAPPDRVHVIWTAIGF